VILSTFFGSLLPTVRVTADGESNNGDVNFVTTAKATNSDAKKLVLFFEKSTNSNSMATVTATWPADGDSNFADDGNGKSLRRSEQLDADGNSNELTDGNINLRCATVRATR
jgi:hypothetical protein